MKKIKHLSKAETLEYLDKYKKILNVEIPKLILFQ